MTKFATALVLILALSVGYFLSTHKQLENDELFTHVSSVEGMSYKDIVTLKIQEGNISPLFYLLQKGFLDFIGFRLPFTWKGDWFVTDLHSQVVMRCLSNLFMSLSIAVVFYFFARFYSLGAGIYGALVALSSFMTLAYWAVARPYSLWDFLTTVQALIFLYILRGGRQEKQAWRWLTVTHLLLSLTVTFSAVQIGAVSLLLFFCKERDLRKYLLLTVVPVILCFVYYFGAPKYSFFFTDSAIQLISASFPKDRLALVFLLGGLASLGVLWKGPGKIFERLKDYRVMYLVFTTMMLVLTLALLGLFMLKAHGKNEGFPLSNRYFIYLTPVGVIATTLFTVEAWKALAGKIWLRVGLVCLVGGLLIFRLNWSWLLARAFYGL
jgi:hypothetical protein